jgi:NAD(P)-dependent dehydrogenase (short-subunit alcohol dehydrogenase family)
MQGKKKPVAIVTGAAGGIGSAIVDAFLEQGMTVVAVDIATGSLSRQFQNAIDQGKLFLTDADLTDSQSWPGILEFCRVSCGRVNVLVNNAGRIIRKAIGETSESDWNKQMDVNLMASYFLSKLCAEEMRQDGWGRIINLSSQAGETGGNEDCAIYAISKGGINTMTRSFARTYAKDGVTVNAIAPGIVMTDMIKKTLTEERIDAVVRQIPIGRVTEASEIAAAAVYLCSEDAGSITGHVLDVNGGILMH